MTPNPKQIPGWKPVVLNLNEKAIKAAQEGATLVVYIKPYKDGFIATEAGICPVEELK